MPQPNIDLEDPIDIEDVELKRFINSNEWQRISSILDDAEKDWIAMCKDRENSLETIRWAQGALAAIESFREIPLRIFKQEK